MYLLDVCRWVVSRLFRRPIAWFWLLASLALWPAVVVFSPVALALQPEDASRIAYEIAFLACLGGTSLALSTLGENRWILEQAGPGRRLTARGLGLFTGGAVGAVASLLAPALLGGALPFEWGILALALTLTTFHVAGLGMLLLQLPMPSSARSWLLPIMAWLLPCWLDPRDPIGGALVTVFRADRNLEWFRDSNPTGLAAAVAPMVALWVAASLFEGRSSPDPAPRA